MISFNRSITIIRLMISLFILKWFILQTALYWVAYTFQQICITMCIKLYHHLMMLFQDWRVLFNLHIT
jgi:hypothetical protein